jgi:hypothetical protein
MPADDNHGQNGTHTHGANGGAAPRARRTSALMQAASALPTVEASLEDFIARANSTMVDIAGWGLGDEHSDRAARDADQERNRELQEQTRAEAELREAELARRLSEVETKLAEAEARVAVLSTRGDTDATKTDAIFTELRARVEVAEG